MVAAVTVESVRWPVFSLSLWFSCATTSQPVQTVAPVATETPETSELAKAFEAEPPAAAPVVTAKPPPPLTDVRAAFRDALEAGQRAAAAKDVETARTSAARATKEAATLGVVERVKAAELSFKAEVSGGSAEAAQQAARTWLSTCGGDTVDACRTAAFNALLSTSKLAPDEAKALREEVMDLQKADACFKASERARKLERCFGDSERLARKTKDELLLARMGLAKAAAAPEPRQPALLQAVDQQCDQPACVLPRRRALARLIATARAEKRFEDAARFAFRDVQALSLTVADAEKAWVRPPETDAVCLLLDTQAGPGTCRKLERQVTGGWTFRDFSKERAKEGLSAEQVRVVNEHYAPLLQECLAAQAKRLRPPESARYEVRWMVFNDGRVGEVHFKEPGLESSELATCVRAQFETWRYPPYQGEWQHVEQSFTVSAVERRTQR